MIPDPFEVPPKSESALRRLTSGRVLARNAAWSLVGQVAPMLMAFVAIPLLIEGLGRDRFGVLTLAWLVIGYFSLFDLGLGRALTKVVAERLGEGRPSELPALVWTSLTLMMALGLGGTAVVGLLTPWLVGDVIRIPAGLQSEAGICFALLAVAIPFIVSGSGLRGVLEARQQFGALNVVGVVMGSFTFVGPLLVLPLSSSLVPAIAVLLAGRIVMWLTCLILCLRSMPALRQRIVLQWTVVSPLIGFGGWLTVNHVISPLMVSLDRLLVGIVISTSAVAYYATPGEAVTRLWGLSAAVVGVLYPAFATTIGRDPDRARTLYNRGVKLLYLLLFPMTLAVVLFAAEGLDLWLGADFRVRSTQVLQLLAIGVFAYGLNHVPAELINAADSPSFTAKVRILELVPYLVMAWLLISRFGIEGAAIAWLLRVLIDTAVLFGWSHRILRAPRSDGRQLFFAVSLAITALMVGMLIDRLPWRLLYFGATVLTMFYLAIFFWFDATEREPINRIFRRTPRWQAGD